MQDGTSGAGPYLAPCGDPPTERLYTVSCSLGRKGGTSKGYVATRRLGSVTCLCSTEIILVLGMLSRHTFEGLQKLDTQKIHTVQAFVLDLSGDKWLCDG